MMLRSLKTPVFSFVCAALFFATTSSTFSQESVDAPKAKNVIYFVADGFGFNNYIAASYWNSGERGKEVLDTFPVLVGMSTFCLKSKDETPEDISIGYDPKTIWDGGLGRRAGTDYTQVTDSGAAGTSLFTGAKTISGRIGMAPDRTPLKLLCEYAAERDRSSGVAVTIMISHATPAAFGAHERSRNEMSNIFNQMLKTSPLSVIMGAGHPYYSRGKKIDFTPGEDGKEKKPNFTYLGGEETWQWMQNADEETDDFLFIESVEDFRRMAQANITIPSKVVGIARDNGHIHPHDGAPNTPEAKALLRKTYSSSDFDELPTLSEMTIGAITLLSRNPNGFVLMVEGSHIDGANHRRDTARSVMETVAFFKAIETAVDWVEDYSSWDETLIVVTSDHETGDLWGEGTYVDTNNNSQYDKDEEFLGFKKVKNNGRGKLPGVQYLYGSHTNQLVPLWAKGPGAELLEKKVRGTDEKAGELFIDAKTPANNFHGQYIDNTDIIPVILEVMK